MGDVVRRGSEEWEKRRERGRKEKKRGRGLVVKTKKKEENADNGHVVGREGRERVPLELWFLKGIIARTKKSARVVATTTEDLC